jgi:hypothetical protein
MSDDETVDVVIGGETLRVPPMTFFCLRKAWPHVMRMIRMGPVSQAADKATLALDAARRADPPEDPAVLASLEAAQIEAMAKAEEAGADFMGQTTEALNVVVAALALTPNPPAFEDLSKRLRYDECAGVQVAFSRLLAVSGFTSAGETTATGSIVPQRQRSNGIDTSQSLSLPA